MTPRAKDDQWCLTPSLLDPTLLGFNLLGNNPWGPSSPASANTLYHRGAGDLHLANVAMNVLTPTCAPTALQTDAPSFQWGAAAVSSGGGQLVGQSQLGQVHVDDRFSRADVPDKTVFASLDGHPWGNPLLDHLNLDFNRPIGQAVPPTAGLVHGSVLPNNEGYVYSIQLTANTQAHSMALGSGTMRPYTHPRR